jgi:hypothetical protein
MRIRVRNSRSDRGSPQLPREVSGVVGGKCEIEIFIEI